eukprot:g18517.t2
MKTLTSIVDARAAAKQDSNEMRQKKKDEQASSTAMGLFAVQQGNSCCGPGRRATSFEDATQDDASAFSAWKAGQPAASGADGRVSPALSTTSSRSKASSGTSSGRSSPSLTMDARPTPRHSSSPPTTVPPLGALAAKMASSTPSDLAGVAGTTLQEADFFLTKGFTFNEVSRDKAVAMMTQVIDNRLTANRKGLDVEEYRRRYCVVDDDNVPMMDTRDEPVLAELLKIYGVDFLDIVCLPGGDHFTCSWPENEKPTTAKMAALSRCVAEVIIPGARETPITPGTGGGGGAAGASGTSANRNKKPRRNDNKLAEDGITGFMEKHMADARTIAREQREAAEARDVAAAAREERRFEEAEKRELARQKELDAQRAHEKSMEQDRRKYEEKKRDEERRQDRADLQAEREYNMKMLELQVQLAQAKRNNSSS